jgi:SynChlorMet cassette radical SAM/SPASM protein ScmE
MSSPKSVDIAITGRCNLACKYCFYADEMTGRTDLPTERWLAFFDELGRLGVMNVCLTGGEVFTRPDLFTLIDGVIANHMRYSLLTNGTLVTEKTLAQFEVGKRRLRLDSVQVSIDGSRAEIHDQSRPHSYERAIRGLKLMLKAGFPMTVRVTINRHNVDDLENIAHLLLDEVNLPSFSTNEAYPCGAVDRSGDIILTPAQRQKAMEVLTRLSAQYPDRISATAGPLVFAQEFAHIDRMLAEGQTCMPGRGTLSACGGVFTKMAVLHDGVMVPCHNLSSMHLGIIGVDDVARVWREHPLMEAVRQRYQVPLSSLDTCRDCRYQGFCTGGCPGGAVLLNGELLSRNPMDCYRVLRGEDPFYRLDEDQGLINQETGSRVKVIMNEEKQ